MGDTAEGQDGDPTDSATKGDLQIVEIVPDGDIVLDVTFEASRETLKAARKAARPRPGQKPAPPPAPEARHRVGYRAKLAVLKQSSKYFDNLLNDTRFAEARAIETGFQQLSLRNVNPSEADAAELPVVKIHEDDEATRSAGQHAVFEDMLRILHKRPPAASGTVTMQYLAVLAVLSDRFDCTATVSKSQVLKFNWPVTRTSASRDGPALAKAAEETLRQKILVSWLLDQPLKMQVTTRELIMYGSRRWSASFDEEEDGNVDAAAWWDLPDDLERELHYRRECILNTIASVQRHFLQLYTSRTRQCKLGYDSSASCDSYQLGEMVKFLASRDLLFLADFSSLSPDATRRDYATVDIGQILAALKQCPSYQIDKNHTNCGLRTRILPIVEYIQAMLSSSVVFISRRAWSRDRRATAWCPQEEADERAEPRVFRFTRSMAAEQRLRYEGAMGLDNAAKALFTADRWDWTPEDRDESRGAEFGRWPGRLVD
ncbi:uncharacterized protein B0T15DRAFT_227230 [Chaetomium strumarium]|uniref:Hydroxyproline-rich glyco protein n=1 Tax=Chaetomium strumarium TaxID=1170767 RepID=A0AAJ0M031_9PEZI|nr:hypothetical protein B0T15DRAFT_227230 [Chaetomium strumarium]